MMTETIQGLITARTLFSKAQELCLSGNKYNASAGLVILQDAIELIVYVCLSELKVDENKNLDRASFDELIGELNKELQKNGGGIIKIQKLKALNKERVIVKHYAHLAEPATVRNFFSNAKTCLDHMLKQVIGKSLQEVMLFDVINEGETKEYLKEAYHAIENRKYLDAMIAVRKAIFVEIEYEYSIEGWKNYEYGTNESLMTSLLANRGGNKAPYYTKNKRWIDENVITPFDYIRLDHEKIKLDLIELGITTEEFWNIWRLTPEVYKLKDNTEWIVSNEPKYSQIAATENNAKYCFETAVSIIWKKQMHKELAIYLTDSTLGKLKVRIKNKTPVFQKASINSKIEKELETGTIMSVINIIDKGLDTNKKFVLLFNFEEKNLTYGFIDFEACEFIENGKMEGKGIIRNN